MKKMFLIIPFVLMSFHSISAIAEEKKSENVVVRSMPFNNIVKESLNFLEKNHESYKPIKDKGYATPVDITSNKLETISKKDYWSALFDNYFKNQGLLNSSYQKDLNNSYSKYFLKICAEKDCKKYDVTQNVEEFVSKNEEFAYGFFYKVKEIQFIPLYFNEITKILGFNVLLFNVKSVDGDYTSLLLTNFENINDFGSGFVVKSVGDKYFIEMEDKMADSTRVSNVVNLIYNVYDISYNQYKDSWNTKKVK